MAEERARSFAPLGGEVDRFLRTPLGTALREERSEGDVAVSSRVRLARNLREFSFPTAMRTRDAQAVLARVESALASFPDAAHYVRIRMGEIPPFARGILVEKHLTSPLLAENPWGAVVVRDDEAVSLMVNEEDHLRLQAFAAGLALHEAYREADRVDDLLAEHLDIAFDPRYGFLTACPTNVGTGMRASVMLHLPALALTRTLGQVVEAVQKVGLVVRGIYGEGTEAEGNLYQISNQVTLGLSEGELLENLLGIARQVIEQERRARDALLREDRVALEDRIYRSYGILTSARRIATREAMERVSDVLLGVHLGLVRGIPPRALRELWVMIRPNFLQYAFGESLGPAERDERRAVLIRRHLKEAMARG
ncbi:MAG: putative ATP:guanido phosphotransferase YacI [Brockia lithotrophica]|uniref:Protein-arginine kinase n=1 Tax=Brockia lithotrophica TaxID=933949 RepID=A0A2T5G516_9BACL|nr:MAG: putative ATP:guanido phosphotransferase YacI [Brockia lithotrophica]